ncbi:MAG: putative molybdenum carrier protein [Deltaproteobacteria bacterium]|nr:putative molybdenum carrier protein [Deltaproteobacteria bacterium]MBW2017732.1 putative molybdenum carrier protein [Deltaproteobacteria bacterium]MBW2128869.1 putative molybdenum carrier protein [Deltaproteobacteria bacterium]MBW2304456.1 putative molybdenum carrier protein [Deltaproteobacteria bacterium]
MSGVLKIVSGGQTGVDRAALDVAIKLGIPHGGWVPAGRRAEDGRVPAFYQLKETPLSGYPERTRRNVVDSDGTLIISRGGLKGGSALTRELARRNKRPWLHVDLQRFAVQEAAERIQEWIQQQRVRILNVAGPRASQDPEIYNLASMVLMTCFGREKRSDRGSRAGGGKRL